MRTLGGRIAINGFIFAAVAVPVGVLLQLLIWIARHGMMASYGEFLETMLYLSAITIAALSPGFALHQVALLMLNRFRPSLRPPQIRALSVPFVAIAFLLPPLDFPDWTKVNIAGIAGVLAACFVYLALLRTDLTRP